jgi:hypothetical protein
VSAQVLLFLVIVLAVFIVGGWLAGRRRKLLATWAAEHGLRFPASVTEPLDERHPAFHALRRGHSRRAFNLADGEWNGRPIVTFDYRYVIGHGKDRQVRRFSAVILQSEFPLRPLSIRPEGFFDRVGEFFGFDDIDFESAEFSRKYHVTGPDKRWAYDVLHARTIEHLLSSPSFSIAFDETHAMVWKDRTFDPETFEAAIAVVEGILDRIPDYVVQDRLHQGAK